MANKSDYKYSVYNALRKKLKVDGIEGDGVVAKILLETFLERKGVLKAAHVAGKRTKAKKGQPGKLLIANEVTFSVWRKKLQDLGWIYYDEAFANRTKRYSDHQAGPKLNEYLNLEKARLAELATMQDIRDLQDEKADRSDLESLQLEVEALKERLASTEARKSLAERALYGMAVEVLGEDAEPEALDRMVSELIKKYAKKEQAPLEPVHLAN